ncbi:MAG: IS481 family transposase [Burkholderiales bacterium]
MSSPTDPPPRDRWARLRFSIIGALLAAPPAKRELHGALKALAARSWQHPVSGAQIRFGLSTLQRWFYAARRANDPLARLRNRRRADVGRFPSLDARVLATLSAQYREHPGWTMQLHLDNLRAALTGVAVALPSYPTLRRYMRAKGMPRKSAPKRSTEGAQRALDRLEQREVRSYELEHVGALWHADFHECSRKILTRTGQWIRPMLLGVIDDRSRLVCHVQWYLDQTTKSLVHGLGQAIMKRGLARSLMTDNGAAMMAEEFTAGLARLGIVHQPTLPYSPHVNAKQENLWARIESRLMAMLEGEPSLDLEVLNRATHAWVELEYHRNVHSEIQGTPLARFLAGPSVLRPAPDWPSVIEAFRIEVTRRVRHSDGTVSLDGRRFEIPSRYAHLPRVQLRYARWDLAHVDLIDARSGAVLCPIRPLDKAANADRIRAARHVQSDPISAPEAGSTIVPRASGMAALLRQLLAEYAATGLPPAYLPTHDEESS